MKKLIALVLSVAMMLTLGVLTVSAESDVALVLEGENKVLAGADYVVSIRLNDASNKVGAFQGELTYSGATVKSIAVNPMVNELNNGAANEDIINYDADSVNFVTLADVKGENPSTKIWFKVTFTVAEGATFALNNVVVSDKAAASLACDATSTLAPEVFSAADEEGGDAFVTLNRVGIIEQTIPNDQAILIEAGISVPANVEVEEYGVVFYPTALLNGAELTVETAGAAIAKISAGAEKFDKLIADGKFSALLHFNFSTDVKAAQFLGTKVSARVFYKVDGEYAYSFNSVDKYIQNGASSKAALNTILDYGNVNCADDSAFNTAKEGLSTSDANWYENRCTVLECVVNKAKA